MAASPREAAVCGFRKRVLRASEALRSILGRGTRATLKSPQCFAIRSTIQISVAHCSWGAAEFLLQIGARNQGADLREPRKASTSTMGDAAIPRKLAADFLQMQQTAAPHTTVVCSGEDPALPRRSYRPSRPMRRRAPA